MKEEEVGETLPLRTTATKEAAGLRRTFPGQPWRENAVGVDEAAAETPAVSAGATAKDDEGNQVLPREAAAAAAEGSFQVSAHAAAAGASATGTGQVKADAAMAARVEPAAGAAAEAKGKILRRPQNPTATADCTGNSTQTAETAAAEEHTAAHATHTCDSLQQQSYAACSQQQEEEFCCWWPARPSALELDSTLRRHPAAIRTSAEAEGRAGTTAAATGRAVPAATAGRAAAERTATDSSALRPGTPVLDIEAEEGDVFASAAGKNSKGEKGSSSGSAARSDMRATSTLERNHLKGDVGAVVGAESVSLLMEQEGLTTKTQQHLFRPCSCHFGPRQSHTSGLFLACITKIKAESE